MELSFPINQLIWMLALRGNMGPRTLKMAPDGFKDFWRN
jgi:hypothetical protein